jgi:hypothetical protein
MKLKSNRDHYQGQNEAWKSAITFYKATFEMPHKFQNKLKKNEIFTTSTYAILASTLKFSAQNFNFKPLFRGVKDYWMVYWLFWNIHVHASLGSLWLGTWWIRRELRLTLWKEEVLGLIPIEGDWHHDV